MRGTIYELSIKPLNVSTIQQFNNSTIKPFNKSTNQRINEKQINIITNYIAPNHLKNN